jgi:hypothetical protein
VLGGLMMMLGSTLVMGCGARVVVGVRLFGHGMVFLVVLSSYASVLRRDCRQP